MRKSWKLKLLKDSATHCKNYVKLKKNVISIRSKFYLSWTFFFRNKIRIFLCENDKVHWSTRTTLIKIIFSNHFLKNLSYFRWVEQNGCWMIFNDKRIRNIQIIDFNLSFWSEIKIMLILCELLSRHHKREFLPVFLTWNNFVIIHSSSESNYSPTYIYAQNIRRLNGNEKNIFLVKRRATKKTVAWLNIRIGKIKWSRIISCAVFLIFFDSDVVLRLGSCLESFWNPFKVSQNVIYSWKCRSGWYSTVIGWSQGKVNFSQLFEGTLVVNSTRIRHNKSKLENYHMTKALKSLRFHCTSWLDLNEFPQQFVRDINFHSIFFLLSISTTF